MTDTGNPPSAQPQRATVFRPEASNIKEESLTDFLFLDPCNIPLDKIPGVGPHTVECFHEQGIYHVLQLMGYFELCWDPDTPSEQYASKMVQWLRDTCKCKANRNTIVMAILCKLNTIHHGFCDEDLLRRASKATTIEEPATDMQTIEENHNEED